MKAVRGWWYRWWLIKDSGGRVGKGTVVVTLADRGDGFGNR